MASYSALGHNAEAVAIEDDKIMYGLWTRRIILEPNVAQAARVDTNDYMARKGLIIRNTSSIPGDTNAQPTTDIIYWGGPDVSVLNGIPLNPGESIVFDFRAKKRVEVYVITDRATQIQVAVSEML